jgi:hypothetical protein
VAPLNLASSALRYPASEALPQIQGHLVDFVAANGGNLRFHLHQHGVLSNVCSPNPALPFCHLTMYSVVQLSLWVLPWAIPRATAFYRSLRSSSRGPNSVVRPPPPRVQRCLNILYAAIFIYILLSFPRFSPGNIFQETKSRLGLDQRLLLSRLTALRQGNLTSMDQVFIEKLESEPVEFRYLYAAYGPDATLNCPFCKATEPRDYFYYLLPALLTPHLIHMGLLGFVTSSAISGAGMLVRCRCITIPKRWSSFRSAAAAAAGSILSITAKKGI